MLRYFLPLLLNSLLALTGCGVAVVVASPSPIGTGGSQGTGTSGSSSGATGTAGSTGTGTTSLGGTGVAPGISSGSGADGTTPSASGNSGSGTASGSAGGPTGVTGASGGSTAGSATSVNVVSVATAARFLDQATFGPTANDAALVQAEGPDSWLQQQFALPPTLLTPIPDPLPARYVAEDASLSQDSVWGSEWWGAALTAPDQLRQRVAFALSHIYVISNDSLGGRATTFYYNILLQGAFANWRQLMGDVTLSPGMGDFLNMANSGAAPTGQIANENFARENMQLFSLGPDLLNADGSLETDPQGNAVPTYTQTQVQAFARAFTGWTYVPGPAQPPVSFPVYQGRMDLPMGAVEQQHDTSAKTLLNGTTLPPGQSARQDVNGALDNIFAHPNLPPFVCRKLIQYLVTSQPSAGYRPGCGGVYRQWFRCTRRYAGGDSRHPARSGGARRGYRSGV